MKKIISTFLTSKRIISGILLGSLLAFNLPSQAMADTIIVTTPNVNTTPAIPAMDDNDPDYAYYLGVGIGYDFNNTRSLKDFDYKLKNKNNHYMVPEIFFGYNLNYTSSVEINLTDNNYTNTNNLNTVESHGYSGLVQFVGHYPLTYDQKLNAYGILGLGETYWNTSLNGNDSKGHFNLSGSFGIGLSYKIINQVIVSAGYKFNYLGTVTDKELSPNRIMRHLLEVRLRFNL